MHTVATVKKGVFLSIFMTIWQIADTKKLIENYLLVGKNRRIWVNSQTLFCNNATSAYSSIEKNIFIDFLVTTRQIFVTDRKQPFSRNL